MTLILELPPELEARLADEAARRSMTVEEVALERLGEANGHEPHAPKPDEHSVIELVRRIHATMPEGALDALPHDGAMNYRHYLYGHPKVET